MVRIAGCLDYCGMIRCSDGTSKMYIAEKGENGRKILK